MQLTNATKMAILAALNAALGLAVVFGAPLTEVQVGAILAFANAFAGLFVGLTFKNSPKRIPD